ncbi:hypothetical protein JCM10295v2_004771 [Rhodotorula toruloides]
MRKLIYHTDALRSVLPRAAKRAIASEEAKLRTRQFDKAMADIQLLIGLSTSFENGDEEKEPSEAPDDAGNECDVDEQEFEKDTKRREMQTARRKALKKLRDKLRPIWDEDEKVTLERRPRTGLPDKVLKALSDEFPEVDEYLHLAAQPKKRKSSKKKSNTKKRPASRRQIVDSSDLEDGKSSSDSNGDDDGRGGTGGHCGSGKKPKRRIPSSDSSSSDEAGAKKGNNAAQGAVGTPAQKTGRKQVLDDHCALCPAVRKKNDERTTPGSPTSPPRPSHALKTHRKMVEWAPLNITVCQTCKRKLGKDRRSHVKTIAEAKFAVSADGELPRGPK